MMPLEFPRLSVQDLFGTTTTTPACFGTEPAVVLIAFRRKQQAQVDTWIHWLEAGHRRFFELPCIARVFAPFRPMIDGGMAAGVGSDEARQRTLTYYGDLAAVSGPLAIRRRSEITVLEVVDGQVTGRTAGSFSDDRARVLVSTGQPDPE